MLENLISLFCLGLILCDLGIQLERNRERKRKLERLQALKQRLHGLKSFEQEIKEDLERLRKKYEHDS